MNHTNNMIHGGQYLMDRRQHVIPWRDFGAEMRAQLDVQHLVADNFVVLMNVDETDLSAILKKMVVKISELSVRNSVKNTWDRSSDSLQCIDRQRSRSTDRICYTDMHQQLFSLADSDDFHVTNIKRRLQAVFVDENGVQEDQSWFVLYCSLPSLDESRVAFARLRTPTSFGTGLGDVQFVVLVVSPLQQKDTKSALETACTFATLMANAKLRNSLTKANSETEFRASIERFAEKLRRCGASNCVQNAPKDFKELKNSRRWWPGRGIVDDFRRRVVHYAADITDGLCDRRAIQKTISSAVFLYFAILPTAVALGMLNEANTFGRITVNKEILSQWIGGLFFGIFGGQLFLIMLSTAPISIYIQVIQEIATQSGLDFFQLYAEIGLWCALFLVIFAAFQCSLIMRFSKRSLEELFGLFISMALLFEAGRAAIEALNLYNPTSSHCHTDPWNSNESSAGIFMENSTEHLENIDPQMYCERAVGLLFLLMLLGTVWLSITLYDLRSMPYLTRTKRELLSDYALPIGVIVMAVLCNCFFADVPKLTFTSSVSGSVIEMGRFWEMPRHMHLICLGLGFPLAILFFMDQMIVTNTVDNSQNNLKKGAAANWDLFVVAVMNACLSLAGLPWMHGALPQAFLHLKSLADVEDRLVDGTVQQVIVKNRETRCATLLAHLAMIPTYFWLLPWLRLIPTCIFHGLFVYLAFTSTVGNELCQRMALLFTEQHSYPPYHYIRRVPQRVIHSFTLIQLVQLIILFGVGFAPSSIVPLTFPLVTFFFIPFRYLMLPMIFDVKYLEAIDGKH